MIVIKLAGTNGSGKSTLARALMGRLGMQPVLRPNPARPSARPAVVGYRGGGWHVLGKYETACGGMDTISSKEERLALIEASLQLDDKFLFFEGLITGKTYGAIGEISDRSDQSGKWIYAFMDTPFQVCCERILQRRTAAGNTAPFDPLRTVLPTFKSVESVRRRAVAAGHYVVDIDHRACAEDASAFLIAEAEKVNYAHG